MLRGRLVLPVPQKTHDIGATGVPVFKTNQDLVVDFRHEAGAAATAAHQSCNPYPVCFMLVVKPGKIELYPSRLDVRHNANHQPVDDAHFWPPCFGSPFASMRAEKSVV